MNCLSKEEINLVRLINRLDQRSTWAQEKPSIDQDQPRFGCHHKLDRLRYWELKSLETTIRHAKAILETIHANPTTLSAVNQVQDTQELDQKLIKIHHRIDLALRAYPAPPLSTLSPSPSSGLMMSEIKAPELPPIPEPDRPSSGFEAESEMPPEQQEELGEPADSARPTETVREEPTRSELPKLTNGLSSQEEMTEELSQMASQLKKNVHHFNKLLAEDQAILQANQTKLELNSDTMTKEGGRLSQVSLKSRSMTWFTIAAIVVVAISWILMFIIIRLT